jgi:uncharacterized protein
MPGQFAVEAPAPASQAAPASRAERIEAIDALRGIALFGVLMVNLVTEFRVSIFAQFLPASAAGTRWDSLVESFVSTGLETKAFSLFSLLFGIGLAIQSERLEPRPDRAVLLVRRLAALLMFGLIHLFLIWNGDILTEYAVAGFMVLPLFFAPRWTLGISAAALLSFYALMPLLKLPIPFPDHRWLVQHVAEANDAYGRGGYGQVLAFNIREVASLLPLHLFALPRTLGLFALGAWLWRIGVFRTARRQVFLWSGFLGVALGLLLTFVGERQPELGEFAPVADQLAPAILAVGYAGVVVLLATSNRTRWLVAWAAPLGRTAFSNYLLQSVIFGFIFYGYGLGLFGRLSPSASFLLGVVVYAAQVVASTLWLRYFHFGPMEWLWRALMYGSKPGMRRLSAPGAARAEI